MSQEPSNEKLKNRIRELELAEANYNKRLIELEKEMINYRTIFNAANDAIFIHDAHDGRILNVNKKVLELYGYTKEELLKMDVGSLSEGTKPYNQVEVEKNIQRAARNEEYLLEWRAKRKNGDIFWVEVNLKAVQISDEKHIIAVVRDISDRKKAEDEIKHQRDRYKYIIEATNVGTWEWNIQTGETIFNEQWANIIGYTLEELKPISIDTWFEHVHPNDLVNINAALDFHFYGKLDHYEIECRMKHRKGSWVWVLARGRVISWTKDGKPLWMYGTHQNITHRKNNENRLRRSEELSNSIQRMGKIGAWEWDFTTKTIFWTEEVYRIHDMEPKSEEQDANFTIKKTLSCFRTEDRPVIWNAFNQCVEEGIPYKLEFPFTTTKGRQIWIQTSAERIKGKNGYNRVVGYLMDITERKQNELTLSNRQRELEVLHRLSVIALSEHSIETILQEIVQDLSDSLNYPIVVIEFYDEANQEMEFAAMTGIPVPTNGSSIKIPVAEALSGVVARNGQPIFETFTKGRPEYKDEMLRSLDVQTFLCTPMTFGEQTLGVLSLASPEPITPGESFLSLAKSLANFIGSIIRYKHDLHESEAKFRSIMDNVGVGVALISPEMKILELNKCMREWFPGIEPDQSPICYRAFNNPPKDKICEYCPTCKTLRDGEAHEATTQTPQPDGIRNFRVISSPIFDQHGRVSAAIEMIEDITEKLSIETQLRQSQKLESVGRLAGGVAHDFNNMLSVILGHGELALEQIKPENSLYDSLHQMMKAARRAADITRQLLAFARKQTVDPKVISLNKTIEGMIKMLHRLIGENIDLAWLPGEAVWPVMIDPTQIDQIMANLCVNARDAIPDVGKITIETGHAVFDEAYCKKHSGFKPGEYVFFAVTDNGCGMTSETLANIYEPFYTTKDPGKGTGLGLAMVYGIVKQNDGLISVHPWV